MKLIGVLLLLAAMSVNSQTPTPKDDPRTLPYNQRILARGFGNTGRWWSLMNDGDKAAFLDGYQEGMRQANELEHVTCEVIRQTVGQNPKTTIEHFGDVAFVCVQQNETNGYDKVTVKDLDAFYSDLTNESLPIGWSLAYLRDKANGRKTAGQLLDALQAEQKAFNSSPSK